MTGEDLLEALMGPGHGDLLLPAATEPQLQATEQYFGHRLPDALRRLYLSCNGELVSRDGVAAGLFFDYIFLGLERAQSAHALWAEGWDEGLWAEPYATGSHPPGAVKLPISVPGWWPFADDAGGNFLAVDFDPGPNGVQGQVINFGRDDLQHFVIAPNFDAFLELIFERYRQRSWNQHFGDPDWGGLYFELDR